MGLTHFVPLGAAQAVKKSHATISSWTWLFKNAFHVGEDGLCPLGRYFSTVDLATVMPIFSSSPTMRGEPQLGFERQVQRSFVFAGV